MPSERCRLFFYPQCLVRIAKKCQLIAWMCRDCVFKTSHLFEFCLCVMLFSCTFVKNTQGFRNIDKIKWHFWSKNLCGGTVEKIYLFIYFFFFLLFFFYFFFFFLFFLIIQLRCKHFERNLKRNKKCAIQIPRNLQLDVLDNCCLFHASLCNSVLDYFLMNFYQLLWFTSKIIM